MGFQDLLNNSPLEGRGWTLQERFLAGRILHFGHQMFWECWETVQSEDFRYKTTLIGIPLNPLLRHPEGAWRTFSEPLLSVQVTATYMIDGPSLCTGPVLLRISRHGNLLTQGTNSQPSTEFLGCSKILTLTAISWAYGNLLSTSTYCGGAKKPYLTKPSSYPAPSWSWASFDGPIDPWIDSFNPSIKITGHEVNTEARLLGVSCDFMITEDTSYRLWTTVFDREPDAESGVYELLQINVDIAFEEDKNTRKRVLLGLKYWALILEADLDGSPREIPMYRRAGVAWSLCKRKNIAWWEDIQDFKNISWGDHESCEWSLKRLRIS